MNESLIKQFFLFESLNAEEIKRLLMSAAVREYAPETIIFREGDASEHFLILLEGSIEIVKSMDTEIERTIKTAQQNDFLGEMSVISGEQNRTASARTRTGARVLTIPAKDFDALARHNSALSYALMGVLLRRMRETESITIQDLKEKNRQLVQSLKELQAAQVQLIEKGKMEVELATARQIQQSMLPNSLPNLPGWELAAHWQPALAVSGDFYDVVPLPDGRLALIVGDVSDKGVPAALLMTVTVSMLRAAAVSAPSPSALLTQVNNLLCPEIPMGMFVTCHVSFLNPVTGQVEMASAGHCRPLLRQSGEVTEIHTQGLALGIFEDIVYQTDHVQIEPGSALLLFSDGLNEAHNPDGEMFGLPAVQAVFAQAGNCLIDDILLGLQMFTGPGQDSEDDITLISLLRRQQLG